LKSAPIAADANSVISANGGLDVDLSNGFVLKGKVQQGAGRDNNILTISGDGDTPTTGYVGAFQYKWYSDSWVAGITRGLERTLWLTQFTIMDQALQNTGHSITMVLLLRKDLG
jgi:hypothetical protein